MLNNPHIKMQKLINDEEYHLIDQLQKTCNEFDGCNLKLELDYKLATAKMNNSKEDATPEEINEFMCFEGDLLIGYLGICSFGGPNAPLELNGMVHPEYRRQGVFRKLYNLAMAEVKKRQAEMLLLSDRLSYPGTEFMKSIGGILKHSEHEMYLMNQETNDLNSELSKLHFRKASNDDALELARQDAIYFGDENNSNSNDKKNDENNSNSNAENNGDNQGTHPDDLTLPEEEEKKGFSIFLAELDHKPIGKINLERNGSQGGIYGLGVLPEYRGKGYGRELLNFGIRQLKEWNMSTIMLQVVVDNMNALGLYQSCGFEVQSTMDYYGV